MKFLRAIRSIVTLALVCLGLADSVEATTVVDSKLAADNKARGVGELIHGQPLDDLSYLRKATIDVVGRIPTFSEIEQYQNWPKAKRRGLLLDRLFKWSRLVKVVRLKS